jgi:hypothetical protein
MGTHTTNTGHPSRPQTFNGPPCLARCPILSSLLSRTHLQTAATSLISRSGQAEAPTSSVTFPATASASHFPLLHQWDCGSSSLIFIPPHCLCLFPLPCSSSCPATEVSPAMGWGWDASPTLSSSTNCTNRPLCCFPISPAAIFVSNMRNRWC